MGEQLDQRSASHGGRAETVIVGAGIAGVAAAHNLNAQGHDDVLVLDGRPPLSLTTAASGENYRDYWPHPAMRDLSSASIDLMEKLMADHGDVFSMRQSGYLFASRRPGHEIFPSADSPSVMRGGATERIEDLDVIRQRWPHLSLAIEHVVVIPRAGSIDVQSLGNLLLSTARRRGVVFEQETVLTLTAERTGFRIVTDRRTIRTERIVLAAGPFVDSLAAQLDVELPLSHVAQRKFVMPDPLGVVPRDMPFTINADPVDLDLSDDERADAALNPDLRWLLETLPAGLHIKPESGGRIKLGWAYNRTSDRSPAWRVAEDPIFPSVVIRGASQLIPGLKSYVDRLPLPVVQYGGYYSRTPENWPLIGPTERLGFYVIGGLSGFGTMTACGAGDLIARHIDGRELPSYANHLSPLRYRDPDIMAEMAALPSDGQL